jgi:amidase
MKARALVAASVTVLVLTSACVKPARPASAAVFDLEEATVADLQRRMETGRDSARTLVDKYLARIAAIDAAGPALHSVIEINPDARSIADALDAERNAKGPRGPLHGIPVLIKDNIATADRMMTTAGSIALEGAMPPADAFIVKRLRDAGAVILGKTNLSEWANFRSTHSTSGWSGRGGQTKNPYVLDRNPSGSSSGSGAAIAASLAAIAIGTETDGSITSPANNNGIVGIKPTLGLVSRFGIIPIAHSQDTAGPMTRTVTDAAILLGALAGADPQDDATKDAAVKGLADYTKSLDVNGLQGARIGVVRAKLMGYHAATDALVEAAIADLKKLGATIVDPADIPHVGEYDASEFEVLEYEFKADLAKYFAWLGPTSPMKSLDDLAAFNRAHADRELQVFGQEIVESAAKRGPLTDEKYKRMVASNRRLAGAEGIDAVMTRLNLDALIAPTGAPAWVTDPVSGDHYLGSATTPAAVAGYPHITVPAGQVSGLPVGLSFFGRAWSEPLLIKFAYAYEQATHHRSAPTFKSSVEIR